jgi:uncharacterized protein YyaL (SSP411 family)
MLSLLGNAIVRYPASFGIWACLLQEVVSGTHEIAIVGKWNEKWYRDLLAHYFPHRAIMVSECQDQDFPLLAGKPGADPPLIYLCHNYSCLSPVFSINELITLINKDSGV